MVMNPEDDSRTLNLTVSIRGLAESQYRTGGLAAPFYGGVEGLAGIRTHQRYFDALRVDQRVSELYTESSFSGMYRTEDTSLTVKEMCIRDRYRALPRGKHSAMRNLICFWCSPGRASKS